MIILWTIRQSPNNVGTIGTANPKINGHFSMKNHRFSGAILLSFCILNGKIENTYSKKVGIYIAIRGNSVSFQATALSPTSQCLDVSLTSSVRVCFRWPVAVAVREFAVVVGAVPGGVPIMSTYSAF